MRLRGDYLVQPAGRQYALSLAVGTKADTVRDAAAAAGHSSLAEVAIGMDDTSEMPAFLHSALCSMSLPVRRPKDEFAPIIRQDGAYSLAITPKPRLMKVGDEPAKLVNLGVPFGVYPRVILITIMTQAVLNQSPSVQLGGSFRNIMREFGYAKASRGIRGQTPNLLNQLDRLLAAEWSFGWQGKQDDDGASAFTVNEVKLSHEYQGRNSPNGDFSRELMLSEQFYRHLKEHAVRFDMNAIYALRQHPTAMDLYTYLAYRLHRLTKPVDLTYARLAAHIGNDIISPTKAAQTMRGALDMVSAVYPTAQIEMSKKGVRLSKSPPPTVERIRIISAGVPKLLPDQSAQRKPAPSLKVVDDERSLIAKPAKGLQLSLLSGTEAKVTPVLGFPTGSLHYCSEDEKVFLKIARDHGNGFDVDLIADAYRAFLGDKLIGITGARLERSFEGFCKAFRPSRSRSG